MTLHALDNMAAAVMGAAVLADHAGGKLRGYAARLKLEMEGVV